MSYVRVTGWKAALSVPSDYRPIVPTSGIRYDHGFTMADTTVPRFFDEFSMQKVTDAVLDAELARDDGRIAILFLWGRDCPNCDIAKRQILLTAERFAWPEVRWLHDNVYDDPTMGTRFGLHGIPAFFLFHRGRKLGRITSWPGADAFVDAVNKQIGLTGATA